MSKRFSSEKLVISYLRFSSLSQKRGSSTKRQREDADEWVNARGLTFTDRLEDLGISAYTGAHAKKGALAVFLAAVEADKIPKGSILVVEALDRLSRQKPERSLRLFLGIIEAGITVVTVIDKMEFTPDKIKMEDLMVSVMRLCLAHKESADRSFRIGKAWKGKRAKLIESKTVLTKRIPAWLKIVNGKIVEDTPKADIVRQIFKWALEGRGMGEIEGLGMTAICRILNQSGVQAIGRRKFSFCRSYINKILHNPQVIGVFQPHTLVSDENGKHRIKFGEPITGYYPPVVDEPTFNAVQILMESKRNKSGGPQSSDPLDKFSNIFQGIMFSVDGSTMVVRTGERATKTGQDGTTYETAYKKRYLISSAAMNGERDAAPYILFPLDTIEMVVLQQLTRLKPLQMTGTKTTELEKELVVIRGELSKLNKRIKEVEASILDTNTESTRLPAMLVTLERSCNDLLETEKRIKGEIAVDTLGNKDEARSDIMSLLAESKIGHSGFLSPERDRGRLRYLVRQLVKRMVCSVSKVGHRRTMNLTVILQDDSIHDYVIRTHTKQFNVCDVTYKGVAEIMQLQRAKRKDGIPVVNDTTIDSIKKGWIENKSIKLIAEESGVSVSTVYRHRPQMPVDHHSAAIASSESN